MDLYTWRGEKNLVGSQASSCLIRKERKMTRIIIADDSYVQKQMTIKMSELKN